MYMLFEMPVFVPELHYITYQQCERVIDIDVVGIPPTLNVMIVLEILTKEFPRTVTQIT